MKKPIVEILPGEALGRCSLFDSLETSDVDRVLLADKQWRDASAPHRAGWRTASSQTARDERKILLDKVYSEYDTALSRAFADARRRKKI